MPRTRLSRRRLLKSSAALAAAASFPAIVPARVLGAEAPSKTIALAAIGTGGRGTHDVSTKFLPLKDARVIAACDCYKARREAFSKMCNTAYKGDVCKTYADFREVLALKDVDGVIISTTDHWHVPLAFYAAQAKKDLYVEKPLGVAMAWAWKLRDVVARNQVVFQYGTQQRGDQSQFRRACEAVRNGHIGKVLRVDAWCPDMSQQFGSASVRPYGSTQEIPVPEGFDFERWIGPAPMKPYTRDRCTCFGGYHIYDYALGFIAGWGAHPLDIAQWGLDTDNSGPVRYEGTGKIPPQGSLWDTIESWDVNCEYASGVKMRFMGHRVAQPVVTEYRRAWRDHGTTFHGEKGWISVDRAAMYASDPNLQKRQTAEGEKRLTTTESQARDFVDAIKARRATVNGLESAIRSDTISHLSDLCIRLNRPIKWDPAKEQILGDEEATKLLDRPLREPWKLA